MEIILNTFGTSINRDNEAFVVTHKDGKQRIPPNGIKSIHISRGAQITSDAVLLAIEKEIEILFLDNTGNPVGRVWSHKYGSVSTIRKGQLNFTFSSEAVEWIKSIVRSKIENQQALLLTFKPPNSEIEKIVAKSISRLEDYRTKIATLEGQVVPDVAPQLRGWEGLSSKIYFSTLNLFLPKEFQFEQRSQHPAYDVVNAMLNYGYGLLYGKIEGSMIKSGIDPYIGVLHRDDYNRPVLVYDVIERYRIWVDYVVYTLVLQGVINEDMYSVREDKSYWLEGLGRRILIQSLNDYMEDLIVIKALSRSRQNHLFLYIQDLAQIFKKFA
jgi:CRISPR-associated protein Cas1